MLIRSMARADKGQWLSLWEAYQAFYKVSIPDAVTEQTWARLFDDRVPMNGFVAEEDGTLVGLVHYISHFSTWTDGPYIYLQDLFTVPSARGKGVGRALIAAVYAAAREVGAARVYWLTHETNEPAIALYEKVADRSGFIQYRKTF